jgi:hypothetical protein
LVIRAGLNYLIENGGVITDAVSTQDWPGEASSDLTIVNWVKRPAERRNCAKSDQHRRGRLPLAPGRTFEGRLQRPKIRGSLGQSNAWPGSRRFRNRVHWLE